MVDQADNLRQFSRDARRLARVIAVSSGKGGVGKTSISVNLGIALARQGAKAVLLDADLGLANVEVLLGLNSLYNLQQVIQGERRMEEILVRGPGGLFVVPGSSGIASIADLGPQARQRVLDGLGSLQRAADFVIIDTMAGIGQNAVSFATAADEVLLVTTPEPSAIVDAYAMLKTICLARPDAVIRLIVNMALNEQQGRAVAGKLSHVAQLYLSRKIHYHGYIPRDPHVSRAVMQTTPVLLQFAGAPAARAIEDAALRLLNQPVRQTGAGMPGFLRRFAESMGLASSA